MFFYYLYMTCTKKFDYFHEISVKLTLCIHFSSILFVYPEKNAGCPVSIFQRRLKKCTLRPTHFSSAQHFCYPFKNRIMTQYKSYSILKCKCKSMLNCIAIFHSYLQLFLIAMCSYFSQLYSANVHSYAESYFYS